LSAFKKLYNLYDGFTHYRNYRAFIKTVSIGMLFFLSSQKSDVIEIDFKKRKKPFHLEWFNNKMLLI